MRACIFMGRVNAYMLTWRTYGSWTRPDAQGRARDEDVSAVRLGSGEKALVRDAVREEAVRMGQEIFALAVCSNHVHVVVANTATEVATAAGRYKRAGTVALRGEGWKGKVWAKGYDKRFCFDEPHAGR